MVDMFIYGPIGHGASVTLGLHAFPGELGQIQEMSRICVGIFQEISGKCLGNFRKFSRKFPRNFREISRKFLGKFQGISRKFRRKFPEIFRFVVFCFILDLMFFPLVFLIRELSGNLPRFSQFSLGFCRFSWFFLGFPSFS